MNNPFTQPPTAAPSVYSNIRELITSIVYELAAEKHIDAMSQFAIENLPFLSPNESVRQYLEKTEYKELLETLEIVITKGVAETLKAYNTKHPATAA